MEAELQALEGQIEPHRETVEQAARRVEEQRAARAKSPDRLRKTRRGWQC